MPEHMVLMPEQRVAILTGMVDDWVDDYEVTLDPGNNRMYRKSAAKDIYPFATWQEGVKQLPDKSGFWAAYEAAFPETPPKGPEDVRSFIERLNSQLPDSIRVVVVSGDVSEYTMESGGTVKTVKALNVGAIAGHASDAEEGHIETVINGETREIDIERPVANSTSIIFISEKLLAEPNKAFIAIAHEGGHEEELHHGNDITDIGGKIHQGVTYHTEVYAALSGIKGAIHYGKWFGVGLDLVDDMSEQGEIYNQVTK